MRRRPIFALVYAFLLVAAPIGYSAEPAEPLLGDLPVGVFLQSSVMVPRSQADAIGQRLGGKLERLTNTVVRVHGRPIQVNVIAATDETNAKSIQTALEKLKSYPFCLRKGSVVVEYVGRNVDAALATKTSYELGFEEKPKRLRYRVTAQLATVDQADYMACNPLFNLFLESRRDGHQEVGSRIDDLASKFTFGNTLLLRNPTLSGNGARYTFNPTPASANAMGAASAYAFDKPESRHRVPYVTAYMEVTVDGTGFRESATPPGDQLTSANAFWPADDPGVQTLAKRITNGKSTNEAKVDAILRWLSPGKNLQYRGQTGSRWGTLQVFKQKFGHCWDFSDCFITLARAAGIPSRQVAGWLYANSGHVWAEFFVEGKGWQQVDPTGGGELDCGIYHIPYFTSENGAMPIVYVAMPTIETVNR